MASPCTKVTDWVRNEVSKPIEDWEERTEQKCKKRHWYDPRSWFCWLVRQLVRVLRWVTVVVWSVIITFVCRVVSGLISILWNIAKFLGNLVKALFTWDKCSLQAALGNFADAFLRAVELVGALFRPIIDQVQNDRLRRYVSSEIDRRFLTQPDLVEAMKSNLNIASGVFGYRLTVTVLRMFVDSETRTAHSGESPHLFYLHDTHQINLFELAGFEDGCAIAEKNGWRRSLPRTAKKTYAGGGGGLVESDPPEITKDELTEYIDSRGLTGPPFRILAMSTRMLKSRIEAAETTGRQLGLTLSFDTRLTEVTDPRFMKLQHRAIWVTGDPGYPTDPDQPPDCTKRATVQPDYFISALGRHSTEDSWWCDVDHNPTKVEGDMQSALRELCAPLAVGIFRYTDTEHSGWTNNPIGTTGYAHNLGKSKTSGLTFRAQIPDEARKYVLIHELGHYFGLTHVDGFDRIMVSGSEGQGSLVTVPAFLYFPFNGGPRFTHDEGKQAWDFILTNFPPACLAPGWREEEPEPEPDPEPVPVIL